MNRLLTSSILTLACCGVLDAQTTQPTSQPTDIPVTTIKLFSSGVGYFERNGTVNGEDHTTLTFKTAQINDILKSLVLQDLDGGTLGTISYPSQDPIDRTLAGFSLDIANNPSLLDLLTQVRGSQITVTYGPDKITGTLIGTETKQRPTPDAKIPPTPEPVLNILDRTQIRAIPLEGVRDVRLDDPKLQHDLSAALLALAGARNQEQKPVDLQFHGKGQRHVKIGYVVEAPVWKSSYRLVLDGDKPHLQGWAMVENQTDADWSNVQLSLVSGRPISFIEDLYSPIYLTRPTVKSNLAAALEPPTMDAAAGSTLNDRSFLAKAVRQSASQNNVQNASPASGALFGGGDESVVAVATGNALGELFSYEIEHVSLARHESAMLPIVTDAINVQKVSVYNSSVLTNHPLTSVRLKNSTGKHLLQGPVTVFDHGSYAGDAQVDNLPPDQTRLLSYGIDLQTIVNADRNDTTDTITAASITKGLLTVTHRTLATHEFNIENKSDVARTIILEEPIRPGWKLVDSPDAYTRTSDEYRFQVDVAAGGKSTLTVKQQILIGQELVIVNGDESTLAAVASTGEVAQSVRDSLQKAAAMKAAVAATKAEIAQIDGGLKAVDAEQSRMRQNMSAIDRQAEYYNRLMKKLDEQETQIEQSQAKRAALQAHMREQQKELDDYLTNLNVK